MRLTTDEDVRTCDRCGRQTDAGEAPDWPNGACPECDALPDWTAEDWQDVASACQCAAAESWRFAAMIENSDPIHAARVRAYGDRRSVLAEDARNVRRAMDAAR